MDGSVRWPTRKATDPPLLCRETMWTHTAPDGTPTAGHLRPCTAPARFIAAEGGRTTPLCGRHANTGRWAGYPDIVWRDLALHPLEVQRGS